MFHEELDRVLDTLLHDLRTPLGAASGYARLLRQGRVTEPAEVDRLVGKMQDALRAMSALCADVSTWRDPEPVAHPHDVSVQEVTSAVSARLTNTGLAVTVDADHRTMTLLDEPERVAMAVATVLAAVARARRDRVTISIEIAEGALRFVAQDTGDDAGLQPFDPWQYGGLQVPLACRTIARAGGHWPATPLVGTAVAIAFPIDATNGDAQ
jgi:signal transduction histidine kinase